MGNVAKRQTKEPNVSKENTTGNEERPELENTTGNEERPELDAGAWRDILSFFILGLTNNFGYVVMLSAAHEIMQQFNPDLLAFDYTQDPTKRECNYISTGVLLLADILPFSLIKIFLPFCPWWLHVRVALAIFLSIAGFLSVALAVAEWMALLGVVCTSAACGIGELTFLAYTNRYNRVVISAWSSGTGAAGVIGASAYSGLTKTGFKARNIFLSMLVSPLLEALAFWWLLRHPNQSKGPIRAVEPEKMKCSKKLKYIGKMLIYIVPLAFVYLYEYFINLGLYEFIYYANEYFDHAAQYRWFWFGYHLGVFIGRSSVNIFHIRKIWIFTCLQAINLIYFLTDAFYCYTPSIWVTLVMILWEGLLGGASYVNTYYKISYDVPLNQQQFAMSIALQSDAWGISLAVGLAIPVHNAICDTAIRKRPILN